MAKALTPYEYINSVDGDFVVFTNQVVNAQLSLELLDALLVAKRFSEDLLTRHKDGEIQMTKNEFNELLDNYTEILKVLYEDNRTTA